MKATKALKRLAKIEALISDVSERYSSGGSHIRETIQDAMAAFARVKAAISSSTAKHPPGKRKKAAAKKTAKKSAPIKKVAKQAAAKKTDPAFIQTARKSAAEEPVPAPPSV